MPREPEADDEAQRDIEGREFDAKEYVRHEYEDTHYDDFASSALDDVSAQLQETEDNCRALVQEQLEVFIRSKDSMDLIFATDKEVFSGKAMDRLNAEYDSVKTDCEELVTPVFLIAQRLKDIATLKSVTAKVYNVLSVPSVIYAACGMRVVAQKEDLANADGDDEDDDMLDGSSDNDDDDDDDASSTGKGRMGHAKGKTEGSTGADAAQAKKGGKKAGSATAVRWFGVELDRVKPTVEHLGTATMDAPPPSARTSNAPIALPSSSSRTPVPQAGKGDYEVGAQAFRRALLYFETHFDILTATIQEVKKTSAGADGAAVAEEVPLYGEILEDHKVGVSAVANSPFTLQLALAVLRAALFLLRELKLSIEKTSPGDTILLDDYLGNFMDISIGVLKLRHFCIVGKKALAARSVTLTAISQLRGNLYDDDANLDDDVMSVASGVPPSVGNLSLGRGGRGGGSSQCDTFRGPDTGSDATHSRHGDASTHWQQIPDSNAGATDLTALLLQGDQRKQHPVEYYLRALRHQHSSALLAAAKLAHKSAESLLFKKSSAASKATTASSSGQQQLLLPPAEALVFPSLGALGNLEDSFVLGASVGAQIASATGLKPGTLQQLGLAEAPQDAQQLLATVRAGSSDGQPLLQRSQSRSCAGFALLEDAAVRSRQAVLLQFVESLSGTYQTVVVPPAWAAGETPASSPAPPPPPFTTDLSYTLADKVDMAMVVSGSTTALVSQAVQIVLRLRHGLDEPETIMATAGMVSTPAYEFFTAVLAETEYFLAAYWTGIGATIHSGAFDFTPEPGSVLAECLQHAMNEDSATAKAPDDAAGLEDSPAGGRMKDPASKSIALQTKAILNVGSDREKIPPIFVVPVLTASADDPLFASTLSSPHRRGTPKLRTFSFRALRRLIKNAADILALHMNTTVNHALVEGYVGRVCGAPSSAAIADDPCLFAAVLVEVLVGHWQRFVTAVSNAAVRCKVAICSTSTSETVGTLEEAEDISGLMQDLEGLRSRVVGIYFTALELVSRLYVTSLALLDPSAGSVAQSVSGSATAGSAYGFSAGAAAGASSSSASSLSSSHNTRLYPRLARGLVSTEIVVKVFNLAALVVDRSVFALERDDEVLRATLLFAPETIQPSASAQPDEPPAIDPVTGKKLKKKRKPVVVASAAVSADPVTIHLAQANAQVVASQVAQHATCVTMLLRGILLASVDALQLRSNHPDAPPDDGTVADGGEAATAARRRATRRAVECIADLVCVRQVLRPMLATHVVAPSLFAVTARLALPDGSPPAETLKYIKQKAEELETTVLGDLDDVCACQLDALLNRFVSCYATEVSRTVRLQGVMLPRFDWQRVQEPTTGARQYLVDALVAIAAAHEALAPMAQPTLAAAAVQQLVGHLALTFVSALRTDTTALDTHDAADAFYAHGLLLLEVEGLVIHHLIERLAAAAGLLVGAPPSSASAGGTKKGGGKAAAVDLSNPLIAAVAAATTQMVAADHVLMAAVQELSLRGNSFCENAAADRPAARGASAGRRGEASASSTAAAAAPRMTPAERKDKRDKQLRLSLTHSRYILEAIGSLVESSALSTLGEAAKDAAGKMGDGSGISIAEKLASRTSASGRQAARGAAKQPKVAAFSGGQGGVILGEPGEPAGGGGSAPTPGTRRRVTVAAIDEPPPPPSAGEPHGDGEERPTTPPPEAADGQAQKAARRKRLVAVQSAISTTSTLTRLTASRGEELAEAPAEANAAAGGDTAAGAKRSLRKASLAAVAASRAAAAAGGASAAPDGGSGGATSRFKRKTVAA